MNLIIRNAKEKDLKEIMKVEKIEYGPINWIAPKEVFEYRLKNCYFKKPGDLFWVACNKKRIVGYITCLIIDFNLNKLPKTREEAIGYAVASDKKKYGFGIKHNPKGNALYAMSIGIIEKNKGIAGKLIEKTIDFVKKNNLEYRVAGLRSWYAKYKKGYNKSKYLEFKVAHPKISPKEYVKLKNEKKEYLDPLMRLYARKGFKHLALKKNYAVEDKIGLGYGELMVWENKEAKK